MKQRIFVSYGIAIGMLLTIPGIKAAQDSNSASVLQVRVNYTGAGSVDEKHKVYVVLWDSADFATGAETPPAAIQSVSSKSGTVTFSDVRKTPAYVSTVYDPTGEWDAQSAPPEGSSLGLYSKSPGKPAPIDLQPGKEASIDVAFDDSVKMKGGRPSR